MYRKIQDALFEIFGDSKVVLCLDCFTVGSLESFADFACPACGMAEGEALRVFDDVELLVGCLEAQEINIHGLELLDGSEAPLATLNLCYADLFTAETMETAPALTNSPAVA